jgi:hypothetical protein
MILRPIDLSILAYTLDEMNLRIPKPAADLKAIRVDQEQNQRLNFHSVRGRTMDARGHLSLDALFWTCRMTIIPLPSLSNFTGNHKNGLIKV